MLGFDQVFLPNQSANLKNRRDSDVFGSFGAIGISDFVLDWPDDDGLETIEAAARGVLPGSRRDA